MSSSVTVSSQGSIKVDLSHLDPIENRIKNIKMDEFHKASTAPDGNYKILLAIPALGWIIYLILWKVSANCHKKAEALLGNASPEMKQFADAIKAAWVKWPYHVLRAHAKIKEGNNQEALKDLQAAGSIVSSFAKLLALKVFAELQLPEPDLQKANKDCAHALTLAVYPSEMFEIIDAVKDDVLGKIKKKHAAIQTETDDPYILVNMDKKQLTDIIRELEIVRSDAMQCNVQPERFITEKLAAAEKQLQLLAKQAK